MYVELQDKIFGIYTTLLDLPIAEVTVYQLKTVQYHNFNNTVIRTNKPIFLHVVVYPLILGT
jgi:hypothetical protein